MVIISPTENSPPDTIGVSTYAVKTADEYTDEYIENRIKEYHQTEADGDISNSDALKNLRKNSKLVAARLHLLIMHYKKKMICSNETQPSPPRELLMNAVKKTNLKTNVFDFNLLPLLTLMLIAFFFQGCGDPGEENIPTTNPQMNRLGDTTQEGDSDGGCSAAFIILKIVEKDVQMELTEGDMCDSIKIFSYKEDLNPIQDFDPGALFYVFQVHKEGVCQIQLTLASGAVVHRTLYGLPPTGGECDMVRAFAGLKIWRPDCEDPTFDSSNNGDCIAQKTQSENM